MHDKFNLNLHICVCALDKDFCIAASMALDETEKERLAYVWHITEQAACSQNKEQLLNYRTLGMEEGDASCSVVNLAGCNAAACSKLQ